MEGREAQNSLRSITKLLVVCDNAPDYVDNLDKTLNHAGVGERIFLRKIGRRGWKKPDAPTFNLPLEVHSEEISRHMRPTLSTLLYMVLAIISATLILIRHRFDAVVAYFAFPQGLVAFLVGTITHRKVLILTDGGDLDVYLDQTPLRPLITKYLRKVACVTAQSKTKIQRLHSLSIEARFCPVIGVDTKRFAYVPFEYKKKNSILFVGRLNPEKRIEVLIKACRILHDRKVPFRLTIVGDGVLKEPLVDLVQDTGIRSFATFTNYVPNSRVDHYYRDNRFFVLPSRREASSKSLLEAMSSGCVCVASDIADNLDIIRNRHNGLSFRLDDERDLCRQLLWAISQPPSKMTRLGGNARTLVESRYSLQAVGSSLNVALASILK